VPLCPNIQELVWLGPVPALRFRLLSVPPSIRSLFISAFHYHGSGEDVGIKNEVLTQIIPRLNAPMLTELRLPRATVPSPLVSQLQEQISSLVLRCGPALTCLSPSLPLSEPALLHVMTPPNLRELKIRDQPPPNLPEPMVIMPSIEILGISGASHLQWLSSLNSQHRHIPPTMVNESKTLHSTLRTLTLLSREGLGPATIDQTLTFTHLTTLSIGGSCSGGTCTFDLTDDGIRRLAVALPRLTHLLLGSVECEQNTCKTTSRSLLLLSVHCSGLFYLETHISTEGIILDVEILLGTEDPEVQKLRSRGRCGLESLVVGHTPLVLPAHSDLRLVARRFVDVFPMLKWIFIQEGRRNTWSRVLEQVSELRNNP